MEVISRNIFKILLFFFIKKQCNITLIAESSYKTGLDDVRREIDIMKKLNHRNIIKLIEIIEDLNGHNLYISK